MEIESNSKSSKITEFKHDFVFKSHPIPTFCDQCSQVLAVQGIQCKSNKLKLFFYSFYS
jgi:hypothetical protein